MPMQVINLDTTCDQRLTEEAIFYKTDREPSRCKVRIGSYKPAGYEKTGGAVPPEAEW